MLLFALLKRLDQVGLHDAERLGVFLVANVLPCEVVPVSYLVVVLGHVEHWSDVDTELYLDDGVKGMVPLVVRSSECVGGVVFVPSAIVEALLPECV